MKRLCTHRGVAALVLSAAATAAMAAPGVASAGTVATQCSGAEIGGQGSSLQKVAQEDIWIPGFKTSTAKTACSGKQGDKKVPVISYNPSGSGAGLRSWGAEDKSSSEVSFAPTNAFVGTDEPPNATQISEIEKNESTLTSNTLETIPVAQESVAIIVHLPSGCSANSTTTGATGRLVFSNATLQGIYAGTLKEWGEIKDGGDTITGTGCATDPIVPVARFDQSGTTHILKRYLGLINTAKLQTENETSETWGDLSEGSQNTVWPKAAGVEKPTVKGGGEVIAKVAAVAGSVGYVNLAEARDSAALIPPEGGANEPMFWVEVQNGTKGKGAKAVATYEDPALNGEVAAPGDANCKKTAYTNGSSSFPPPSIFGTWNEVTTSITAKEKDYSLCGMTYDLAFTTYSLLPGTSEAEATAVHDYVRFITGKKEGQKELEGNDYEPLPKEVGVEAVDGANEIGFDATP
jgi:ABC-type phosphate transport system substrate-binding protein